MLFRCTVHIEHGYHLSNQQPLSCTGNGCPAYLLFPAQRPSCPKKKFFIPLPSSSSSSSENQIYFIYFQKNKLNWSIDYIEI